jgi:GNAT superfamily N-acetyltransferase
MTGGDVPSDRAAPAFAGWMPGAIGRIALLHSRHYAASHGFGLAFEARVATELSEFLGRFEPERDHFVTVLLDGEVEGSIAVDGAGDPARLRWFILSEKLRGHGLGRGMLTAAVDAARAAGHRHLVLSTLSGLDAADHLYRGAGFRLLQEHAGAHWGTAATEREFALDLVA